MVELELPHDLTSPACARARVDDLGLDPESRQLLKLVVSELVTNAVVHGRGPVSLRLDARGNVVQGEVSDGGDGFENKRGRIPGPNDAEGGRGLFLVDRLCRRVDVEPGTSRVRFEFQPAA